MKLALPAAITAAVLIATGFAAPAEAATSPVKFTTWVADPKGADQPNNTGWNREYIVVKNTSRSTVVLTGWVVRDSASKHTFTFPKGFALKAGAQVTLHSGRGKNTASHLYFNLGVKGTTSTGRSGYVWNNTGDTAQLVKGRTVMKACTYKKVASGTKTC